ncbi:MAG: thioredoxin domain-containing protein [Thermonemataceae bacterium]
MNALTNETSPYLLQHAQNPVQWYPWGEEALKKAVEENKPIIVSIGYSACHWCHVMERESFESKAIAAVMNEHFVCIKVDREERPDVDNIYMDAIQAMGLQGGWPLNVFLLPDKRPFYGGTYFPPQQWQQVCLSVAKAFREHYEELEESAEGFTSQLAKSEQQKYGLVAHPSDHTPEELDKMYETLTKQFDPERGGLNRAPKFPMPSLWLFLLRYAHYTKDEAAVKQLHTTLEQMALGGIYDEIGGGFARYSVDADWFCPHFEKMLYDNAQLVGLYAEAYHFSGRELYKQVVYETIDFVARELTSEEGGFYAALDADSEGEEGKYYVWRKQELESILGKEIDLFGAYYQIQEEGNWEEGKNILHRTHTDEAFAEQHGLSIDTLREKIRHWKQTLLAIRRQRVAPGLDDKILAGWNGLMLKGLVDAYRVFNEERFLHLALQNAHFLKEKMIQAGQVYRTYKAGKASIPAFLEDYAALIQAFTNLYQVTFEEQWLTLAHQLTQQTFHQFYDQTEELFFYTQESNELIARKKELFDSVIPSSNALMAHNLFWLSKLLDHQHYEKVVQVMLAKTKRLLLTNVQYTSYWGVLFTLQLIPIAEVAIVGENALALRTDLEGRYHPHKILAGSTKATTQTDIPLLMHREAIDDKTTLYVCYNKACQLPVSKVEDAWEQINMT